MTKKHYHCFPTLLLLLVLQSTLLFGQTTYTSTGAGGNWSNAASWSPAGVPGSVAGDNAIIASGSPITIDISPANALANLTVNAGATLTFDATGTGRSLNVRDAVTVNGSLVMGAGSATAHTLTLQQTAVGVASTFTNNGTVNLAGTNNCNIVFTRSVVGTQSLVGTGTYTLNNLTMTNTALGTDAPALPGTSPFGAEINSDTQTLGQAGAPAIALVNLTIDNRRGQGRQDIADYAEDNATLALVNLNISGTVTILRGYMVLNNTASSSRTHSFGNLSLGSTISTIIGNPVIGLTSNTALITNSASGSTSNLTITGNATGTLGNVALAMTSRRGTLAPLTNTILNVNGNLNFSDTLSLFASGGLNLSTGTKTMTVGGDFIISNPASRFIGDFSGGSPPTLILSGGTLASPVTVNIPAVIWTGDLIAVGNANCQWQVNGNITMPAGSALTVNATGTITLGNTASITMQDGSEIRAHRDSNTPPPNTPTFTMGTNALIRVADPQGLGDGTATNTAFTSSTQAAPVNWSGLPSISTNGTIEYNGVTTQAVTARTYNTLVINNTTGTIAANPSFPGPPFPQDAVIVTAPNNAEGNITATTLRVERGVLSLAPTTGTFTHAFGSVVMGSVTAGSNGVFSNAALVVNNAPNTQSTVNVTGNVSIAPTASNGALIAMLGPATVFNSSPGSAALNITGSLIANRKLVLTGNAAFQTPSGASGIVTNNITVGGNFIMNSVAPNNGQFFGDNFGIVRFPTITLTGTSSTFDVLPVVFLGTGPFLTAPTANAAANFVIASGASVNVPSGSAIWANRGNTLTVNGTLDFSDGAAAVCTQTGAAIGNSTLIMGANGIIRTADVDGLGDGLLADPVSNAPTFVTLTSPSSATPGLTERWNLVSSVTNGTIDYNGTSAQVLTPRNPVTTPLTNYNNLIISGGGAKNMAATSQTNTLALNNGIVVNSGAVELLVLNPAGTSVTGGNANSYVNGNLTLTHDASSATRRYPIGNTVYRPISLVGAAASGTSTLRGAVITGDANALASVDGTLLKASDLRYYNFLNTGTPAINLTQVVDLGVNTDDIVNVVASNATLKAATRTSGLWTSQGPASVNTSALPTVFSSNTFSPIVVGSGTPFFASLGTTNLDNPLPVELMNLAGRSTTNGVVLNWETGVEIESRGFTVMRRKQGDAAFADVASFTQEQVLRAQNRINGATYRFVDRAKLEPGTKYEYKLAETGLSGIRVELQLTATVEIARRNELAQNYPNPFNPATTISFQIANTETVSLKVYDMLGREVAVLMNGQQNAGRYDVRFDATRFASGIYFYRLQAGGFTEMKKMILVK
jgi:hypothetical protein